MSYGPHKAPDDKRRASRLDTGAHISSLTKVVRAVQRLYGFTESLSPNVPSEQLLEARRVIELALNSMALSMGWTTVEGMLILRLYLTLSTLPLPA